MPACAVASCRYRTKGHKNWNGDKRISFFSFPKDQKRAKIWWLKCKRKDKQNYGKHDCICSIHFQANDFVEDVLCKLYKLPIRKPRICNTAIPSLNLPSTFSRESKLTTRTSTKW